MNIHRIKKKYPYHETKATVIVVEYCRSEEGFVPDYGKLDAMDDLISERRFSTTDRYDYSRYEVYHRVYEHADRHWGVVDADIFGDPVSKVYKHWYKYGLHIEYDDLDGIKHQNEIEITSMHELSNGDQIDICILIDNPQIIRVKDGSINTIEEYTISRGFMVLILVICVLLCSFFAVSILK